MEAEKHDPERIYGAISAAMQQTILHLVVTEGICAAQVLAISRMTYRRLAEVMLKKRVRLGQVAYDLHAMRYRGAKELAWPGCDDDDDDDDDDEIMSYSGHSTKAMVRKYAGEARQEMRARQAREKRR